MPTPDHLIKMWEYMKSKRATFDLLYQAAKDYYTPDASDYVVQRASGEPRTRHVYDGTPILVNEKWASVLESFVTPRDSQWHTLRASLDELNDDESVKVYFETLTKILFRMRARPVSGFYDEHNVNYKDLALGNCCLRIDLSKDRRGLIYQSIPTPEVYIAVDDENRIDTIVRHYKMTAHAARMKWGEKREPPCVKRSHEAVYGNGPFDEHEYLHVVMPRMKGSRDYDPERRDDRAQKFEQWEISLFDKSFIPTDVGKESGGSFELPNVYTRLSSNNMEVYARGPAIWTTPNNLTLQDMKRTALKQGKYSVEPPLLTAGFGANTDGRDDLSLRSGALNAGWLSPTGTPLVQTLDNRFNYPVSKDMMDEERETLNDAHLITLFRILVDSPGNETATEVLARAREKSALIGPPIGRLQSRKLGPTIVRELGLLERAGLLPPPPPVLVEAGDEFEIEYDSEATSLQREQSTAKARVWLEDISLLQQVTGDQSVGAVVNSHKAARWFHERRGVSQELLSSERETQQAVEDQAEAAQAFADEASLPDQARAVKDLAQAQALGSA